MYAFLKYISAKQCNDSIRIRTLSLSLVDFSSRAVKEDIQYTHTPTHTDTRTYIQHTHNIFMYAHARVCLCVSV